LPSNPRHPVSGFQAGVFAKTASMLFCLFEAAMSRLEQAAKTLQIPQFVSVYKFFFVMDLFTF
jgi:hypothetical protein